MAEAVSLDPHLGRAQLSRTAFASVAHLRTEPFATAAQQTRAIALRLAGASARAILAKMAYDDSILANLSWLELAGYVGLFVFMVWALMQGPLHRLGDRHQWTVIVLLAIGFPALIAVLKGSDDQDFVARCASALSLRR